MALYREFRRRLQWQPKHLSDYIPWRILTAPGVMLHKQTHALQRTYELRGPDLVGETKEVQGALMLQANNVLKLMGGAWTIHSEAQRSPATHYPESLETFPVATLIDTQRRRTMLEAPGSFVTRYYMTLTWRPPSIFSGLAERLFVSRPDATGRPRPSAEARQAQHLETFLTDSDHFMDLLKGILAMCRPLSTDEMLTYLHSCVSDSHHPVVCPSFPIDLDAQLCDRAYVGGWYPYLEGVGTQQTHLRTCSVMSFPATSYVGVLNALNHLAFPYRWWVRWIALEKHVQAGLLQTRQKQLIGEEKGLFTRMGESVSKQETRVINTTATRKAEDIDAARQEIGMDVVTNGYFSAGLTIASTDEDEANTRLKDAMRILDAHGFTSTHEKEHATAAWLSSIPGNTLDSVRRTPQSSLTWAHVVPGLNAAWPGPERDEYLNGPAWFQAHTQGHTQFSVVNHVLDVGHTLVLGPTGSGKSTIANLLVAQWLARYPNAQVFWFDVGRSARCLTLALGGHWYDLGGGEIGLQPYGGIDDALERRWMAEWTLVQLKTAGLTMTGSLQGYITNGLAKLAGAPRSKRTISQLILALTDISRISEVAASKRPEWQEKIQAEHMAARQALEPFTGSLLDADHDDLQDGPLHTFEQETLLTIPRLVGPVMSLIFHRLEGRFDTRRPTFMPMDEAAIVWAIPDYRDKGQEWMMTKRKKSVSLAFFTHSISQVFASELGPLLMESCPTWFMLPNPQARIPKMAEIYDQMGFNTEEIRLISEARPQRDVYYRAEMLGKRPFSLHLSPLELALMARNTQEDHERMDMILATEGREGFAAAWLTQEGDDDEADHRAGRTLSGVVAV